MKDISEILDIAVSFVCAPEAKQNKAAQYCRAWLYQAVANYMRLHRAVISYWAAGPPGSVPAAFEAGRPALMKFRAEPG